jgi:hypothetical protein
MHLVPLTLAHCRRAIGVHFRKEIQPEKTMVTDFISSPLRALKIEPLRRRKRRLTVVLDVHTVYENTVHQKPHTMPSMLALSVESVYVGYAFPSGNLYGSQPTQCELHGERNHSTMEIWL